MKTRSNLITERAGVNFVRTVVESAGSLFKEINLQHDYGHDATIMLVVDGKIQPREIALQIKSGASYISPTRCTIPFSQDHLSFWAKHDLDTVGIVYDPKEGKAWWTDLRAAAQGSGRSEQDAKRSISFAKSAWNEFNKTDFTSTLLPILLGEPPSAPVERLCEWVKSEDFETHDIGVRAVTARYRTREETWRCLIDTFRSRPAERLSLAIAISFARMLGHHDIGYYSGEVPPDVLSAASAEILCFGHEDIAKILAMLPETDFERPSLGYNLLPVLGMTANSQMILQAILDGGAYPAAVRKLAGDLLQWQQDDPHFWRFWRRDRW